ncbi:MAG: YihY/virulence factor BrkB family protein [Thermodesulfobacteriota bacterium]
MNQTIKNLKELISKSSDSINNVAEIILKNRYLQNVNNFFRFLLKEIAGNELTIRAMSMVYITLLSLVPLLALSFSILKAFGVVENKFQPLLDKFVSPLGDKGIDVTNQILEFIGRTNFGVLGFVGLLVLLYTVFSLINKIESSLNKIWKVNKGRSVARRFSDYISITLIGPVIMFAAIGLTASLASNTIVQKLLSYEIIGDFIIIWGKLLPLLIVSLFFTFIYKLVPNTEVKIRSALIGGIVAGISWQLAGWIFAYIVKESTQKVEIYSSLAVLIFFMMWIYINWLIVLIGAQITFCLQNLRSYKLGKLALNIGTDLKEKLSLLIMYLIGKNYLTGHEKWTLNKLVNHIQLPHDTVLECLDKLVENNLIVETDVEENEYLPNRSLETISLKEILYSVRKTNNNSNLVEKLKVISEVNKISENIENALSRTLENITLRDIIKSN